MYQRKPDGIWIEGETIFPAHYVRHPDMAIDKQGVIYLYTSNGIYSTVNSLDITRFAKSDDGPLSEVDILVDQQAKQGIGIDSKGNILAIRQRDFRGSHYNVEKKKWTHFTLPPLPEKPKGAPERRYDGNFSYPHIIVDGPRGFILGVHWINHCKEGSTGRIGYLYNEDISGGAEWKQITFIDFKRWTDHCDLYLDHKGQIHMIYLSYPPFGNNGESYLIHTYGPPAGPFKEEILCKGGGCAQITQTKDGKYHFLVGKARDEEEAENTFIPHHYHSNIGLYYFRGDSEGRIISESKIELPVFTPDKTIRPTRSLFINKFRFGSDIENIIHGIYVGSGKYTGYIHCFQIDPNKIP